MRITSDYHTHTVYSHGKGSIEDNVKEAINKGLKIIGISDHGYKHIGFGMKRESIPIMRKEIDMLQKKYNDIKILYGVEANILDDEGNIDVESEMKPYFDYIMAGYHFGSTPTKILRGSISHIMNYVSFLKKFNKEYNTRAVINAMKNNDIFAITHPGAKAVVDILTIAKVAKETGTALEINASHGHLNIEELLIVKDTGVNFVIGSDAHIPENVGNFQKAIERAQICGINEERIINA